MKLRNFFLSTSLFLTPAQAAEEQPFHISPDLDHVIQQGLSDLYNFHFDKALALFETVKDQASEHPMVAFGVASTHWWRISSYVLEADEAESKPFLEAVDTCLKLSEAKIKTGDPTGEAHLVYGGALGLRGRWEATNRKWLAAYLSGKKAYKYLSKALEINPEMADAYMGHGIFDYYVATLPAIVRNLAFIGMGSDRKVGLQELERAAQESRYAKTPSKLFLAQIYTEMENAPDKSLDILKELRVEYPVSPFMHMMVIIALYNEGKVDDLFIEAASYEKMVEAKVYSEDYSCQAKFSMGATYFRSKKWVEAAEYFRAATEIGTLKDPWRTWARLYLGYATDVQGKRKEAIKEYKTVLRELRRWGSHDNARAHLKRPFQGTDQEIKKLEL